MSSHDKRKITLEGRIKLPLSLALVGLAVYVSIRSGTIAVIPMLLSFCGDIFMMKHGNCFRNKGDNDLYAGMFAFMMSHVFYVNLMETPKNEVIIIIMVVIATIFAIAIAFGSKNKIALTALYVAVLILNVSNTFWVNTIALMGGMLFLVSDVMIGIFDIMHDRTFKRHLLVWGTYVPAQILMLCSFLIK